MAMVDLQIDNEQIAQTTQINWACFFFALYFLFYFYAIRRENVRHNPFGQKNIDFSTFQIK